MTHKSCGFKSRQPHQFFFKKDCLCARVVELADSLDSGSSVHYARAGSSPASRTKSEQAMDRLLRLILYVRARSRRCSSFPTATRCAGLAVGGPPCGRHFSFLTQISVLTVPATSEQALYRLLRFFIKVRARSFCCSFFPNRTHCVGLRLGAPCGRRFSLL